MLEEERGRAPRGLSPRAEEEKKKTKKRRGWEICESATNTNKGKEVVVTEHWPWPIAVVEARSEGGYGRGRVVRRRRSTARGGSTWERAMVLGSY